MPTQARDQPGASGGLRVFCGGSNFASIACTKNKVIHTIRVCTYYDLSNTFFQRVEAPCAPLSYGPVPTTVGSAGFSLNSVAGGDTLSKQTCSYQATHNIPYKTDHVHTRPVRNRPVHNRPRS